MTSKTMTEARRRARKLGASLSLGKDGFEGVRVFSASDERQPRTVHSGLDSFNVAIGLPGLPEGRFIIFHGPEASGKTTLALHAVAEFQRAGGVVAYLDFECKLDMAYAEALGVDLQSLIVVTPPYIEKGFDFVEACINKSRAIDPDCPILFVWDSLQSAIAKRSFLAKFDKDNFQPEAGAYSRGLGKVVPKLAASRAVLLGVSQVRMDLSGFVSKEKVGVGKAPPFYASIIVKVKVMSSEARGSVAKGRTGDNVRLTISKNQVSAPHKVVVIPLHYGTGFDAMASTLQAAELLGLAVPGKGGYFTVNIDGDTVKVHGRNGLAELAEKVPAAFAKLRAGIAASIGKVEVRLEADPDADGVPDLDEGEGGEGDADGNPDGGED